MSESSRTTGVDGNVAVPSAQRFFEAGILVGHRGRGSDPLCFRRRCFSESPPRRATPCRPLLSCGDVLLDLSV